MEEKNLLGETLTIKGIFFIPTEQSEGRVRNSIMDCGKSCPPFLRSVTSFYSRTIEARGLKFGMPYLYMNASKVTNQIFDILLRS